MCADVSDETAVFIAKLALHPEGEDSRGSSETLIPKYTASR